MPEKKQGSKKSKDRTTDLYLHTSEPKAFEWKQQKSENLLSVSIPHPAFCLTPGYITEHHPGRARDPPQSSGLPPVRWEYAPFCRLEYMVHVVLTLEHFWQIKPWEIAVRANSSLFITQKRKIAREKKAKSKINDSSDLELERTQSIP